MSTFVYFLIPIGLLATTLALGFGIYAFTRGGAFNKKHSNKIMRLRVELQAITIAVLMVFTWLIVSANG